MLFDLRGRGRRRTVQVIYLTLAVLMGGGLVFFGIGGSVSGGLFDAVGLTNSSGTNSGSASDQLKNAEKAAARRAALTPQNPAAWAALADARFKLAGQGDNYDQNTGTFRDKGKAQLQKASDAWTRYLALKPEKPDSNVARLMLRAYSPDGLRDAANGVTTAEIVAAADPNVNNYGQLAIFAYAARQTRKGDLAAAKAIDLTPADQRRQTKSQLDAAKKQGGFPPAGSGGATQQPQPSG
jgi:hypothetical protein